MPVTIGLLDATILQVYGSDLIVYLCGEDP